MTFLPDVPYPLLCSEEWPGIPLCIPDPVHIKEVYEKRRAADPGTAFPFWARIWPAARALTLFLQEHPSLYAGQSVLEIGAGIGLPSFHMAGKAAAVCMTDHDPEAVALMKYNVSRLQTGTIQCRQLDWNDWPEGLDADLVICSDLNYAPAQFSGLLRLLKKYLARGSRILLATPERIMGSSFVQDLMPYSLQQETMTVGEPTGTSRICLLLLSGQTPVTADRSSLY